MKYILSTQNNYFDINLNEVANIDSNIKAVIDTYGFDINNITDYKSLVGYKIIGMKQSTGIDIQSTLKLNTNYSFILIEYDFSNEDYIKLDSDYKVSASKDKINWCNYINETEYLESNFDLKNINNATELLNDINNKSKYINKIKNNDFKYLLIKVDTPISNIKIQSDVNSCWYIKVNNINANIENDKLNIVNSSALNEPVNVLVFKIGCDDNILDTIKEF